jgi:secreted protein with Ig-like and vWFA domain
MNPPNDNHELTATDDLTDRLLDRGLTETLGNDSPPDLSARILAAQHAVKPMKSDAVAATPTRHGRRWVTLAVAATLLVGMSALLLSEMSGMRLAAFRTDSAAKSIKDAHRGTNPKTIRLEGRMQGTPHYEQLGPMAPVTTSAVPLSENATVPNRDFDSLTGLIVSTTQSETWQDESKKSDNLSLLISESQSVDQSQPVEAGIAPAAAPADLPLGMYYASEDVQYAPPAEVADQTIAFNESRLGPSVPAAGQIVDNREQIRLLKQLRGFDFQKNKKTPEGTGPGLSGDQYARIVENPFIKAEGGAAVSTFSIDVDTASYANVRQFLVQMNQLPPPDAVRIEELVNYFDYDYEGPAPSAPGSAGGSEDDAAPFAAHVEVAGCPWAADHRLVRIGIKGRELDRDKRPKANLVFLVDVSGSMDEPAKLPLVIYGLQQLTRGLGENDRVAIVVYASSEGLVLPSTPGTKQQVILEALGNLSAGGSTAGGAGIQLAYKIAEDNFIEGGTNRVILCTDGDFNVGVTSSAELERMCQQKAKDTRVFLSVLGFGRGNLNDTMMQAIANHGNGNHYYVDNRTEARRVLVEEMTGTLVTIAKDVKIQVEFNPAQVAGYRLIGYENRMLRTEDFNDDKKDAGEIGAGHTVTALYEVVPAGKPVDVTPVDDLKYQPTPRAADADYENALKDELLTLKMRYKAPEGDTSKKLEWPVTDDGQSFSAASNDCQFAAAVAGFGMLLRDSQFKGNLTYAAALELAQGGIGEDKQGYRAEFLDMVRKAMSLKGE